MSSRLLLILVEEALQGPVLGGVVGDAVLPAVPDDGQPGAGQDPDGVRVVVAPVAGPSVEVGGPGVGLDGVAGEIAEEDRDECVVSVTFAFFRFLPRTK